jgi:hypothetical protein
LNWCKLPSWPIMVIRRCQVPVLRPKSIVGWKRSRRIKSALLSRSYNHKER